MRQHAQASPRRRQGLVKDSSIFVLAPYIALSILAVGLTVRYFMARRQLSSLADRVQEAKGVFDGRLWRLSLLVLIAGHLAGLLAPRAILSWNGSPARLSLLAGLPFVAGVIAVVSGAWLIWRHFGKSSASFLVEMCDTIFLALVFVVLISGLLVAIRYRWASSWGVMTLTPYTLSLLRGRPAVELAA